MDRREARHRTVRGRTPAGPGRRTGDSGCDALTERAAGRADRSRRSAGRVGRTGRVGRIVLAVGRSPRSDGPV
ncbi:hypothetical protein DEI91_15080 [Curtobacterium sp. MCBD17_032]|nr:hypothetical protein DEI91_15080 [Curtobacterium sp. MCBD17_032]